MKLRNKYGVRLPTAPGLVLYLPMLERSGSKAYDRSGKGNHGAIHGATWAVSERGSALSFDGDNDYVDCGNDSSLDITDKGAICVWMKHTTIPITHKGIINKKQAWNSATGYSLYYDVAQKAFIFIGSGTDYLQSNTIISDTKWHYIVITFSETNGSIYVDGVDETLDPTLTAIVPTSVDLKIGQKDVTTPCHFDGAIDDVHIYDRTLTAEQTKRCYEQPKYDYLRAK